MFWIGLLSYILRSRGIKDFVNGLLTVGQAEDLASTCRRQLFHSKTGSFAGLAAEDRTPRSTVRPIIRRDLVDLEAPTRALPAPVSGRRGPTGGRIRGGSGRFAIAAARL